MKAIAKKQQRVRPALVRQLNVPASECWSETVVHVGGYCGPWGGRRPTNVNVRLERSQTGTVTLVIEAGDALSDADEGQSPVFIEIRRPDAVTALIDGLRSLVQSPVGSEILEGLERLDWEPVVKARRRA